MAKKAVVSTPASIDAAMDIHNETWTDYVLSLLREDEKADGKYPKYNGLVRIAAMLKFEIIDTTVQIVQSPEPANNNRATAIATIRYALHEGSYGIPSGVYSQCDAADCSAINTRKPFSFHPVATASTMAQSRVLRKILRLNTHTAEEMNAPDGIEGKMAEEMDDRSRGITVLQKNLITSVCQRLEIDLTKFLVEFLHLDASKVTPETLGTITETEAQHLMRQLQGFQKNPSDKEYIPTPDSILLRTQ